MIELFRNNFFIVRCDSPRAIVEVARSNVAFRSAREATLAFTPMLACLDSLGRSRFSLLLDARDSIANNDAEYESWYARYRVDLVRDFRRVAILMRTPAGSLQASRLLPPAAGPARVFLDAALAWAFVAEPVSLRPSRRSASLERDGVSPQFPDSDSPIASEHRANSGVSPKPPTPSSAKFAPRSSARLSPQSTASTPHSRAVDDNEESGVSPTSVPRRSRRPSRLPSAG